MTVFANERLQSVIDFFQKNILQRLLFAGMKSNAPNVK